MLILKKVAVTGGLSSGKTSVCEIFKRKGAYVVSADEIVHNLLSPDSTIAEKVVRLLGDQVSEKGSLNRAKIANIVFENKEALKALERILHPAVLEEIENQYKKVKDQKQFSLFIAEIPLLYEIERQNLFDSVITVSCDSDIAKKRFREKTDLSKKEFENRMIHQLSPEEKASKADYIIQNNGDLTHLETQVNQLYQQLTQD